MIINENKIHMCLPLGKYVVEHIVPLSLNQLSTNTIIQISKMEARSEKGRGGGEKEKKITYLCLRS